MPSSYLTTQYKDLKKTNQTKNEPSPPPPKTKKKTPNIEPTFENAITENK